MNKKVAVVIPSYKVKKSILSVISEIGEEVSKIYVVDDACPERSGEFVKANCKDKRVEVLFNPENSGVGGATITGFKKALEDEVDIVIKLDGDGQMNPKLIPTLIAPLLSGSADYVKGNRFFHLESLKEMPLVRLIGNAGLSFISKAASGYWNLMDPTNGYIAIDAAVLKFLPLEKINKRFFFESDLLFRLNTIRAVVREVPMDAVYKDETSNLNVFQSLVTFPLQYLRCFIKRIFYTYFLRGFGVCSLEIILGSVLFGFGFIYALYHWCLGMSRGIPSPTGTVMLAAIMMIFGFQLLLAAVLFDMQNIPEEPLVKILK
ncbi:MAG: glycosyltransferase family 2 protein [Bdellovibrionota bacterium]|jgi:dolichol-phosphate mannosyltransferase